MGCVTVSRLSIRRNVGHFVASWHTAVCAAFCAETVSLLPQCVATVMVIQVALQGYKVGNKETAGVGE